MTNKDGSGRRDVLRSLSGLGLFSSLGRSVDRVDDVVAVNVGYRDRGGLKAAADLADDVVHTFSFDAATVALPERLLGRMEALATDPSIRYIELDRPMSAHGQQLSWGAKRIGVPEVPAGRVSAPDIDIAILDSGIDSTHPDLRPNVGSGTAFTESRGLLSTAGEVTKTLGELTSPEQSTATPSTPGWHDPIGHGTHIAGIVGAVDNSRGIVGVVPDATLHAVRVLGSFGVGSTADIAAGIEHVTKQGWEVANLSFGAPYDASVVRDACSNAVDQGTLLVASTGNNGPCTDCVRYPAVYPTVIGVGATTRDDTIADFSATGPETDIVAPGEEIRSTYLTEVQRYKTLSGTSMATPYVAGAGGLLMAQGYTNTAAADRLLETAQEIGLAENEGGAGMLDLPRALGL